MTQRTVDDFCQDPTRTQSQGCERLNSAKVKCLPFLIYSHPLFFYY